MTRVILSRSFWLVKVPFFGRHLERPHGFVGLRVGSRSPQCARRALVAARRDTLTTSVIAWDPNEPGSNGVAGGRRVTPAPHVQGRSAMTSGMG